MRLFRTIERSWRSRSERFYRAIGRRLSIRTRKRLALATLLLVIFLADLGGLLVPLDRTLLAWRFALLPSAASGEVVVVEIDAATFAELPVWPFPRQYYARVIDEVVRAGAETIVLDVDFSAHSGLAADEALAEAIARTGRRVILPAFVQRDSWSSGASVRDVTPLQSLAANAHTGAANVVVEADGRIWRYEVMHRGPDGRRPSLAALAVGGSFPAPDFLIDYSIRPETLPRLSFSDLYMGLVAPGRLAGKTVVIGATAVELGDEFPVPVHGYQPGVVVQALAIETLVQQRALQESAWPVTSAGMLFLLALATVFVGVEIWHVLAISTLGIAAVFAGSLGLQLAVPFSLNIGAWILGLAGWLAFAVVDRLHLQAVQLFRQRMAMAYRRALMRNVVEDSFDGIIVTDSIGRIELFNRAASQMLGVVHEEAVGRPLKDLLPQIEPEDYPAGADHRPCELALTRGDGRQISVEMLVSRSEVRPSRSRYERRRGPRAVYVYTFRDVSLRKNAEIAMQKAIEEALRASQAKSDFIANMSHEFRTPLNAIIGFADLMRHGGPDRLQAEKALEYIGDIHSSGMRLLALVNDILDLSRIENDALPITLEWCDPAALLLEPVRVLRPLAESRRVKLMVDVGRTPRALCDPRAMHQCLINLLSNAVKFSEPGASVTASVGCKDGKVRFSVRDEGPGMAPELLERVGQPFLRASQATIAAVEGTGLGLAITRRLIERQDGSFEIASRLGFGTTVTVSVPAEDLADRQQGGTSSREELSAQGRGR